MCLKYIYRGNLTCISVVTIYLNELVELPKGATLHKPSTLIYMYVCMYVFTNLTSHKSNAARLRIAINAQRLLNPTNEVAAGCQIYIHMYVCLVMQRQMNEFLDVHSVLCMYVYMYVCMYICMLCNFVSVFPLQLFLAVAVRRTVDFSAFDAHSRRR